jgi:addiction module HigA family antidote
MDRRTSLRLISGTVAGATLGGIWRGARAARPETRPDVLVVVVDDLRWDEFGAGGHPYLKTPNIDRLAREGVSFTRAFKNRMRPVHPGEVLREGFLEPLGMSANALARTLSVPAPRINDVVRERRGISADTAMRLARYFGGDACSWLNLQTAYDLRVAEINNAKRIAREVSPAAA